MKEEEDRFEVIRYGKGKVSRVIGVQNENENEDRGREAAAEVKLLHMPFGTTAFPITKVRASNK